MTLAALQESVLSWIIIYGPIVLCLAVFIGALGLPLPGTLFLIAAGAFVRQGILSLPLTVLLALAGVVVGDLIGYGLGRWAGKWLHGRYGRAPSWRRANDTFQRRGAAAIFMTRWLLTPIAVPTNWISGSSRYPFTRWLFFDTAGELMWIVVYGGLGFIFSSQWEIIGDFISEFSWLLLGAALLLAGVYFSRRRQLVAGRL